MIPGIYIEYGVEHNDKNLKFKVGDCVRISKYSNIFEKGYTPKKSEAVFVIKKVKNTVPQKYIFSDLNDEETVEIFNEKELKKQIKQSLELKRQYRKKPTNYMARAKVMIMVLTVGLTREISFYKIIPFFPKTTFNVLVEI